MKAIIIDIQRGVRRLSSNDSYPTALGTVGADEMRIIDWQLSALRQFGVGNIVYIGGYHIQKVIDEYPQLKHYYHDNWQQNGILKALLTAEHEFDEDIILLRSDILFRVSALEAIREAAGQGFAVGGVDGKRLSHQEKSNFDKFHQELLATTGFKVEKKKSQRCSIYYAGISYLTKTSAVPFKDFARKFVQVDEKMRSEERRVGKECRSRWSPYH